MNMNQDNFDDRVIAERELERAGEHGGRVVVRMGTPVRVADGEWGCPFQIRGAGDERIRTAYGVDGMQALQLCMEMIRADLGALQRSHRLTWLGEDDLGF